MIASSSLWPEMTDNRLLKSGATPPTSCPIAALPLVSGFRESCKPKTVNLLRFWRVEKLVDSTRAQSGRAKCDKSSRAFGGKEAQRPEPETEIRSRYVCLRKTGYKSLISWPKLH